MGALLTLSMRVFMLVFIVTGVLSLMNYSDPQITQYKIFDNRSDGREINLGESYGNVLLGWFDMTTSRPTFLPPDPRFCTFEMQVIHLNYE